MKDRRWRVKNKGYKIIRIKGKGEWVQDERESRMEKGENKGKGWKRKNEKKEG